MEGTVKDFVTLLADLGPLKALRDVGLALMHVVFVVLLVREGLRHLRERRGDYITVLLHYGVSLMIILSLPELAKGLIQLTRAVSSAIYADQNITEFFARGLSVSDGAEGALSAAASFLDGHTVQKFIARSFVLLMLVVKVVLIDIIWQILFGMKIMLGAISIPISLAFGGNVLTTWFRKIVELMLWPVIYSFLMLTLNATVMDKEALLISYDTLGSVEEDLKRIAASWTVILLTVITPFLARGAMDFNVGYGGMVAQGVFMMKGALGRIALAARISRMQPPSPPEPPAPPDLPPPPPTAGPPSPPSGGEESSAAVVALNRREVPPAGGGK